MDAPGFTSQPSYLEALPKVASSSSPVQSVPLDPETNPNDNDTSSIPPAKPFAASSSSSSSIAAVPRRRDLRRQFVTIFLASLGILQAVKAIGILIRARKSSKSVRQILVAILRSLYKLDLTNIKSSLFFSAFPVLYRYLTIRSLRVSGKTHHLEHNKVRRDAHNNERSSIMPRSVGEGTFFTTVAPILVLGPLANLLPANIITQLNLYVICAAGMACARVLNDRVENGLTAWQSKADRAQHGIKNAARGGKTPYVPYYMNKTANKDAPFNKHFSFLDPDPSTSTSASAERVNRSVSSTSLVVAKTLWKAVSYGGGWWLFPLTQGLLLDTAVFESDCFPTSYKNVIVSRSKRYLPSAASLNIPETSSFKSLLPSPTKLITMLPLFTLPPFPHPGFPLSSDSITTSSLFSSHVLESQYSPFLPIMQLAHPAHNRAICATLHPLQPSCSVNFLASVKESMGSAFALVGGYSAIMTLLKFKKIRQDPRGALLRWLISSVRGAGFVTLAISNAWAWVCVFQRTLNPNTLQRGRFGLGGMLAGLWVFLVPAARRLELGLYSVRLSMLTLWKIGLKKGWWKARRRLAFAPFAIGLAILVHLKRQRLAPMESWVGKGVTWLDGDHETLVKTNATSERKLGDMKSTLLKPETDIYDKRR